MKLLVFLCLVGVVVCELSKEYVRNNNQFLIDLMRGFDKHQKSNLLFSTFSIETLLALTSLGAKGQTAEQIRKAIYAPQSEEKLKELVKIVGPEFVKGKHLISLANEIFLAKGIEIEPSFIKTATELFKAEVKNVDFGNAKEAVKEINSDISVKTNGKITDLIQEKQIKDNTRMMLVNALYFKGIFEKPFKPEDTEKRDFYLTENSTIKVDTMKITDTITTYTSRAHKMTFLFIPYESTEVKANFAIVVPHEVEGANEVMDNAHHAVHVRIENYVKEYATVYVPKFKLQSTLDLKPVLQNMGITDLFTTPDLSGITKESVKVDSLTQKIVFKLDEGGTEAAVATAANSRTLSIPNVEPKVYRIDRPFFFGVTLDEANIIGGRIVNPLEDSTN